MKKVRNLQSQQWCRSLLSIGGIIWNFTLILHYFEHWGGMNLDHDLFQVSKLSEDQKKRSSPEIEEFFFPKSREDHKKGPNII